MAIISTRSGCLINRAVCQFASVILVTLAFTRLSLPAAQGQTLYDQIRLSPPEVPERPELDRLPVDIQSLAPDEAVRVNALLNMQINGNYLGRAAVSGDNTRLAPFAKGNFLPSAIPAPGQPFFGTDTRMNVRGNGNAVRLNGYVPTAGELRVSAHAQFVVDSADFVAAGDGATGNIAIREAFGRINRLSLGIMETAFADPAAVPETLDLAGPNARLTINDAGLSGGVGRISYDFFSPGPDGFKVIASLEQPLPQIPTDPTTSTFAHYPDLVATAQWVQGDWIDCSFAERWHLQFSSVLRDLGRETAAAVDDHAFGWGAALSGSFRFPVNDCLESLDRFAFSITYGEGIAHYIVDLNAATDAHDAVITNVGDLQSIPVFAWYVGYTHNWRDDLRSTVTYSRVSVDNPAAPTTVPTRYRSGEYFAVNLLHHFDLYPISPTDTRKKFFTGLEFLFGDKTTENGSHGDASRLMWVTVITK